MNRQIPSDPLAFIRSALRGGRILWSHHVNMRLEARALSRSHLLASLDTLAVIEEYPEDKYLPSYLCLGQVDSDRFHVLLAADVAGDNVRVVTMYRPDPSEWDEDLRKRI